MIKEIVDIRKSLVVALLLGLLSQEVMAEADEEAVAENVPASPPFEVQARARWDFWLEEVKKSARFSKEEGPKEKLRRAKRFLRGERNLMADFAVGERILLELGEGGMGKAYTILARARRITGFGLEKVAGLLERAEALGDKEAPWIGARELAGLDWRDSLAEFAPKCLSGLSPQERRYWEGRKLVEGRGAPTRNFAVGARILLELGEEGVAEAYTMLGRALKSRGAFGEAKRLLERAEALGEKEAGKILDGGGCRGGHPERVLAAAERGGAVNMRAAGDLCLYGGWGRKGRDFVGAIAWYERALEEGEEEVWGAGLAACQLGRIYRGCFGDFGGVDHKKAVEMFHVAEKILGAGEACFYLALHYANGDGVARDAKRAAYYADGAVKGRFGGSLDLKFGLLGGGQLVNPRKDAVMVWRKPIRCVGAGDRF